MKSSARACLAALLVITSISMITSTGVATAVDANAPEWQQGIHRLGNRVWFDENRNGRADAGEPGIGNVTVVLQKNFKGPQVPRDWYGDIAVGQTNSGGYWGFKDLSDGCYRLSVRVPVGHAITIDTVSNRKWFDYSNNDINPETGYGREVCFGVAVTPDDHFRWDIGLFSTPVIKPGFSMVAGGDTRSCGIAAGKVECWGYNAQGILGDGTTVSRSTPVEVPGIESATAIEVGYAHSCALIGGGTIKCWGGNRGGQLGTGDASQIFSLSPVNVAGIADATMVTAGGYSSCAVVQDGTVKCWGSNGDPGQFTDAQRLAFAIPTTVVGITNATDVAVAEGHFCALISSGAVKCWGNNNRGQLGDGSTTDSPVPVDVVGITDAVQIEVNFQHSCARTAGGSVKCWGTNHWDKLPDGSDPVQPMPLTIQGLSGIVDIGLGLRHSCAVTSSGTVKCWGLNFAGQLGDGTKIERQTPVDVVGAVNIIQLGVDDHHSCAVATGGVAQCWGWNFAGQLGNGTTTDSSIPVTVVR